MLKIAIGISSLCVGKGGSERAAVNLANEMQARGHQPYVISYDIGSGHKPAYPLNKNITYLQIPPFLNDGKHAEIKKLRAFLKNENLDVFIAMQSDFAHMLWALSVMGTGIPLICSERTDPEILIHSYWNEAGRNAVLSAADAIHELLPVHADTIPEPWRNKACIIPNSAPHTSFQVNWNNDPKRILFLGRFIKSKRPMLLLKAFSLLIKNFPDWKLVIAGYGPEKKRLERALKKLALQSHVIVREASENVSEEYSSSSIYCLPTAYEGFPNSVLEAMSAGLPIVGVSDCRSMSSLVIEGKNGLLANSATPESLAETLKKLMESPELRKQMGNNSFEICRQQYSHEFVFNQWENLIKNVAHKKGNTVMDSFMSEPFASMATLSSAARKEYLYRNFGEAMPWSLSWFKERSGKFMRNIFRKYLPKGLV